MIFDARSVAVIGASDDPAKVGGSVLANLVAGGFPGRIVPVNRARSTVQGLRAAASILDVAEPVDVAVVAVPAAAVLGVLKECVAKGVGSAVVISAGFGETGGAGREREGELRAWLAGQPIRVLGPNCLGWMRPSRRLNLTFAPGMPAAGAIGFFSHSGALCTAILDWSRDHHVGFSLFASLGNQAGVTETDVLQALAADDETRVIAAYLEGVADGRAFFEALTAAASARPCVLLKSGRSAEGARAVASHTGALAGSDAAFDAAVRQAGALRAESLEELFDLARALVSQPLPSARRLVVVTNGGGLGILATDAARAASLDVPPPAEDVRARLARVLPAHAALGNPIDLIGDATAARYDAALRALGGGDPAYLVMLAPQAATDAVGIARSIVGATRGWTRPVLAVLAGGPRVRPGVQALEEGGIPCYPFPEPAVRALAGMATLAARRARSHTTPAGRAPAPTIDPAPALAHAARLAATGQRTLGFIDARPWLDAYGIRAVRSTLVRTPAEAARAACALGFPVALKIVSADVVHKTEVGGVRLGLRTGEEVAAATAAMHEAVTRARPGARVDGVLVQEMGPPDASELLLGMVRDPQFGPLVMVGFGGIYVEVLHDIATRLAPFDAGEAAAMLDELRMAPVLRGARGRPPADLVALADTISRFARLAADVTSLRELEINPLLVGSAGSIAVDVRGALA
jgi:acetate---CoA ligase (ADP-forming)